MNKVHVDIDEESPFLKSLQRAFPSLEIEAKQVTANDHACARAFSHLATKLIEQEVDKDTLILDIGSAPARRMMSDHKYHCVCPVRSAEDPERLVAYAKKLADAAAVVLDRKISQKIHDLNTVMATPDSESDTFCLHTDATCRMGAEVAVYQDVYAVHAPTSLYLQAVKGVRTAYWIGFDTTPFMFSAMAGAYPSYATNWSDEQVLQARNIGLCATDLTEGRTGKLSILRKKMLRPSDTLMFSVGSTLYTESRKLLKSWHLPSTFHLKGKQSFTCRCDTIVSCEGYVMKKITMCPGLYGKPVGYAVTHHAEGFLVCKVTDTVKGERMSFPVCTYVPSSICDQMTGIMATEVTPDDAQKLLVGLNQRIVVNGRTQRNTNTMKNYLLPVVAMAFSKWAKEYKADLDDEKPLGVRERSLTYCCLWAFKTRKTHTIYKKPDTQSIVKVPCEFNSFIVPSLWSSNLSLPIRRRVKLFLAKSATRSIVERKLDSADALAAESEELERIEAEKTREALPPLIASTTEDCREVDVEELEYRAGAGVVETPRCALKITAQPGDVTIGSYIVLSPQTVLKSCKLQPVHALAEQVKIITHSGRSGRYQVEGYDGRVLLPCGVAVPTQEFQALSESATMVYNEREYVNRKLYHIALHGPALNTDEENYEKIRAERAETEYVFDVDKKQCVKREEATGIVLTGELTNPPFHEFAYEGLKRRPAAPYKITTVGVFGVPGSGKSAIIKNLVTADDLVTSGKKENCTEITTDVKRTRGLDITAKTVDSILLNGVRKKVRVLFVDEAFACHAGTLLALIALVRPTEKVVLCGDPKQCGFFNLMQLKVNYNHNICTTICHKSISRRCTPAVTAIVSTLHYGGKMRTTNTRNSPIIIDTTGQTKPKRGDLVLTCFRGWVKQLQLDYRGHEVMTAAASQGLTRKGVYAVRQKVNENPLYAPSSEHVNVLLTRTEDRLVWKTLAGDPWIKVLTNIPKGNFSASLEEWQAEHDDIMRQLERPGDDVDEFQNKANVCWAKCLVPVLQTAGIRLTAEEWSATIKAFNDDAAYSPEVALNEICTRMYGVDLDSGLFSSPTVSLYYSDNHWDNRPGGKMYGFNREAAARIEQRHPFLAGKWQNGKQLVVAERKEQPLDAACNIIPINRRLPHALVAEYKPLHGERVEWMLQKIKGYHVLLVSEYNLVLPSKRVTWIAPLHVRGADRVYDLNLGLPTDAGRFDTVFVNIHTEYRLHHYQQCVDHAMRLQMLGGDALRLLKPGGTLLIRAYGYADKVSESVVLCLSRKFQSFRVLRPMCVTSNTEVFLLFQNFDNGKRVVTLHQNNRKLTGIYSGEALHTAGCAPSYRVKRADIATSEEEAVVNAANAKGRPGDGVCRAIHRKWPEAFVGAATATGTAKTIKVGQTYIIHAVGPNFSSTQEQEGDKLLAGAYRAVAEEVIKYGCRSVAIPLLSTGIYGGGKDRMYQSLNHLFTALDATDADVVIYCRDKTWETKIQEAIDRRLAVELVSDEMELQTDLVRVHPDSSLVGRRGYSTTDGKLYSYLEGTKFHQCAVDMAEILVLWPNTREANEQIALYALGESMDTIRSRCPVDDNDSSSPPRTVPCLCRYAMTAERVTRLRMHHTKSFTVCSSFPLPKYNVEGVQRVKCEKVLLFDPTVPSLVSPRKYVCNTTIQADDLSSITECSLSSRRPSVSISVSSISTTDFMPRNTSVDNILRVIAEIHPVPTEVQTLPVPEQGDVPCGTLPVEHQAPVPPPRPKRARALAAARIPPVPAPRHSKARPVPAPRTIFRTSRPVVRAAVELPWKIQVVPGLTFGDLPEPSSTPAVELPWEPEESSGLSFGDFGTF
ncbi:non structural polyprotein nsP123 [Bebaru virus]|uniref:Polyprotein P1234 n=4 Tax=Bebaru virus TaxID=59305 RepID=H6STZ4_9VIRU|nr:non structural polyprotein nsP123 [Bebaru virus]AEJ36224.1 non structural polyprotein [Bebaru virus]